MSDKLRTFTLNDKYVADSGTVFMTGTQALVRLPLVQKRLDQHQGLKTAGFISGYRGSPLAGFDQALWKAGKHLKSHHIHFQPGINEDLGATAVWGSQQVHLSPGHQVEGVFAMWYSKGPGIDRSGDVLKHANFAGTSRLGGVLALAGDDHACKSSTLPHQSDYAFVDAFIPIIHPATVQDIIDLGIYGWALSRFSGLWVGFKMTSDTVDSGTSVRVDLERYKITLPPGFPLPPGGLHLRWPDAPLHQEQRMHEYKMKAVPAFVKANSLNKALWKNHGARIGFIAVGKGYLELRQAFDLLGITEKEAQELGIALFKVVVSWPLEPSSLIDFCDSLQDVIIVEEKRPLIESQLKEILYHLPAHKRPQIIGKTTESGMPFLPSSYELNSRHIAQTLAKYFYDKAGFEEIKGSFDSLLAPSHSGDVLDKSLTRSPYYCSGCPHNISTTQLPEGSRAMAGIGCHYMAIWMNPYTQTVAHMGGEGVPWIGTAPFTAENHIFTNMGDGTYYHSGFLAIRASLAAKVNMTYKILYNDAIAMTGGQPVEGSMSVSDITRQVHAEGVRRIAVVSDDIQKYPIGSHFAPGTTFHHRNDLSPLQEELKNWVGTSVLIYDQTCAAEKRRRRKRQLIKEAPQRLFINDLVCEGCGDCGKKSNCLSLVPLDTEWGRKRLIDQSSCNKDFSCLEGFCPSFVSVVGGQLRRPEAIPPEELGGALPIPAPSFSLERPYNIFITGVGGTGVVTIGALISMAAHLEGKGAAVIDMAGLAQKGGAVVSHLRISQHPGDTLATRVGDNQADLILGFDLLVTAGAESLKKIRPHHTKVLVNSYESMTGGFTQDPDFVFPSEQMRQEITKKSGDPHLVDFINGNDLMTTLMGDSILTNIFMVGYAFQKGFLPVSLEALEEAIRLNGTAVSNNMNAFHWGRLAAVDLEKVMAIKANAHSPDADLHVNDSLSQKIDRRVHFLTSYQDASYAARYAQSIQKIREKEALLGTDTLTHSVAQTLFRLMAYKDEYEVARLYTDGTFQKKLKAQFTGAFKLRFHLAPPLLARRHPQTGELKKIAFGSWVFYLFRVLAPFKKIRGTKLDIFGYTAERRMERQLIHQFEEIIDLFSQSLTPQNLPLALEISDTLQKVRGFGHVKQNAYEQAMTKIKELIPHFHPLPPNHPLLLKNL